MSLYLAYLSSPANLNDVLVRKPLPDASAIMISSTNGVKYSTMASNTLGSVD
ncbi:MAG: hypothetical protein ACTSXO_10695 [Candidatus Heimdallarchaeota archaeon]